MNKIHLFAIATILATASLMAGIFTVASSSFAQTPTTPSGDMGATMMDPGASTNTTGNEGNATSGTGNLTTAAPM